MTLFCPIRNSWVAAQPEEKVRQELLQRMLGPFGYPKALIAVEKELSQLVQTGFFPKRRADILCFGNIQGQLLPLLLIECKAIPLTDKVVNQVVGYNSHVKARYIAVANQTAVKTGWYDPLKRRYVFVERLPLYEELLKDY